MTLWTLALRNVLRNARRSLLAAGAVAVGLTAVMFGQSLLRSFQRQMIDKATGVMLGHAQVQAAGVKDRKVPEKLLTRPERFSELMRRDPRVKAAGARLLYTGLVYSATASRGVLIAGIEPDAEKELSIIPGYLTEGRYFGGNERDAVMGAKLARELDVRLGERIVVMAQRPGGEMQSELFRVAGLYHTASVTYDGQIVYVPLAMAQRIRGAEGKASHVAARLHDGDALEGFSADLGGVLGDPGAIVLTYKDVGSEVVGIKKFQDAILIVIMLVIYLIVGLGILNSVSMSLFERIREFGVIRAVGARPSVLVRLILAEAALLGGVGVLAGAALGGALIGVFGVSGLHLPLGTALSYFMPFDNVVYMRAQWGLHARSALGLWAVCVGAAVGPAVRAARLVVSEALRHV
ncbi:MAG: ABC-type transport system, permease component [Elusimicrobia bacterium]|nr:MAG: ABC-type transport system, permease component [Elusimicrobiota bacterium]